MLKFSIIFTLLPLPLGYYIYRRFFKKAPFSKRTRIVGAIVIAGAILLVIGSRFIRRDPTIEMRDPVIQAFYWASGVTMGALAFIILYSAFLDLPQTAYKWLKGAWRFVARRSSPDFNKGRREFLSSSSRTGVLLAAGVSTGLGVQEALGGPYVKEVQVPVKDLPNGLDGFKIVQISDLHVGPMIDRDYVLRVSAMANALRPDLIALTGDFVDGSPEQLRVDAEPLATLQAKHGVFYCTGNHEFFSGVEDWVKEFRAMGFNVLENEHRVLDVNGAKLLVAGVHDYSASRRGKGYVSSPTDALKGAPAADFKMLLAHQPRSCFEAADAGFDLQLSGHTHAGQFFPFSLIVHFAHPYVKGLNRHADKMWVYVNQATGYWGPPIRFGVPAEVTLLVLRRG